LKRCLVFLLLCVGLAVAQNITIHIPREDAAAAKRAADESELMALLKEDFANMDAKKGHVDLVVRRRMDVLMNRLMTKRMWQEP